MRPYLILQERINNLVKKLVQDFAKVKANSINDDFLQSEQYSDVVTHIFNKAKENKYVEKIELFTSILIASSQQEEILNDEFIHNYVEIISALNKYEMQVLHHLYNYHKGLEKKIAKEGPDARIDFKLDYSDNIILDVPKKYFAATFDSLIAKGLAYDDGVGRFGGTAPKQYILPTELCNSLMRFVEKTKLK